MDTDRMTSRIVATTLFIHPTKTTQSIVSCALVCQGQTILCLVAKRKIVSPYVAFRTLERDIMSFLSLMRIFALQFTRCSMWAQVRTNPPPHLHGCWVHTRWPHLDWIMTTVHVPSSHSMIFVSLAYSILLYAAPNRYRSIDCYLHTHIRNSLFALVSSFGLLNVFVILISVCLSFRLLILGAELVVSQDLYTCHFETWSPKQNTDLEICIKYWLYIRTLYTVRVCYTSLSRFM